MLFKDTKKFDKLFDTKSKKITYLYVMNDKIAGESFPCFEAQNDLVALRMFSASIEKGKMPPEDFELIRIAEIDHNLNEVQQTFHFVVNQITVKQQEASNA